MNIVSVFFMICNLTFVSGILLMAYDVAFGKNLKSRKISFYIICAYLLFLVISKVGGNSLIFMNN